MAMAMVTETKTKSGEEAGWTGKLVGAQLSSAAAFVPETRRWWKSRRRADASVFRVTADSLVPIVALSLHFSTT